MKRPRMLVMCLVFLLPSFAALAQTQLKAAVGLSLPPYVLQKTDNGLEVDIVREALKDAGYSLTLDYVPFARIAYNMAQKADDCALTINESSGIKGVFYSDSHITYQNVVVTLKSKGFKVSSSADLKGLRVSAFQDAPLYLGADFAAMAKSNPGYSEVADQATQVKLLFSGRADALVMDINIFKYFRKNIADLDVSQEVTIASVVFPPTPYKVAFTSKEVCDKFNVSLKKLRDSGRYAEIFKNYIN